MRRSFGVMMLVALASATAQAQTTDQLARLENDFRVVPDVTYLTASGMDAKLDLYAKAA